jgi:hypothetical protein
MISVSNFEKTGISPTQLDAHINAAYEERKVSKRRGKRGKKDNENTRVSNSPR